VRHLFEMRNFSMNGFIMFVRYVKIKI
jgi:hypothetical protein